MVTRLDNLLSQIDADVAQSIESRARAAASTYSAPFTISRDASAIRKELCRYVQLIDKAIGKQSEAIDHPDSLFWDIRVRKLGWARALPGTLFSI